MTDIIQQQIDYYRARAEEYDEWWYRKGRYDRGEEFTQKWFEEAQHVRDKLHQIPKVNHILELAPGTGIWTEELIKLGDRVTAVDASSEMIVINHAKLQSDSVDYIEADLFTWDSSQEYDLVFFSFWLSHVPREKLEPFLQKVGKLLKPDGYFFMLDSRRIHESTAADHQLPEDDNVIMERVLNDGRSFDIVKIFYETNALKSALSKAKIEADVVFTDTFFIFAKGQKVE